MIQFVADSQLVVIIQQYLTKTLTFDILKKYIWERENNILKDLTNDTSKLNLWYVDVKEVVVVLLDDIVRKLGGKKISPLETILMGLPEGKIHIIISAGKCLALLDKKLELDRG